MKLLLSTFAFSFFASTAPAAVISFDFEATQTSATGTPNAGGQTETAAGFDFISGTFSYDTSVADSTLAESIGTYATGTFLIDQFDLTPPTSTTTSVINQNNITGDRFIIQQKSGSGATSNDLILSLVTLDFDVLATDDLPISLDLADYPINLPSQLTFQNAAFGSTTFSLSSLERTQTPAPVPLPAGGLLLLSGLAGVAGLKRWKKRAA